MSFLGELCGWHYNQLDCDAHIFLQVLGGVAQDFTMQISTAMDELYAFLDILVHIRTIKVQLLIHEVLNNIRQQTYLHLP